MELEQDKILQRASNYWGQQITKNHKQQNSNRIEQETVASVSEFEPKKDFIDRIFTKSTNFWSSLFSSSKESPRQSRKNSDEVLQKHHDEEVFNLFHPKVELAPQPVPEEQRQNDEDFLDFVQDSHPLFNNPYYSNKHEPQDGPVPDSLFYLDNQVYDEEKVENLPRLPVLMERQSLDSKLEEKAQNGYQLQNVTDSKIRIRRTNSQNWMVKRKPFTTQEDMIIIELLKKHGRNFALISEHLPGRTEQMVRNRYKSKIRKLLKINESMDTESDPRELAQQQDQPLDILHLQYILKNQFINESNGSSTSTDLEKLQKIKQLQNEIAKIENLLQSTKSEIIKEYVAILNQNDNSIFQNGRENF